MQDAEVDKIIQKEAERQSVGIELIPSENYTSKDVREALGSVFTHKYAEGYPGKRYYGGQEYTDAIEQLAIDRARTLFAAAYANVQPHSGSSANLAVYSALLEQGDIVLGMDLSHGGHLTHGHPLTLPAKIYTFVGYKTKEGKVDLVELEKLAREHKPKILLVGFSSYTRELPYAEIAKIGKEVGAYLVADVSHIAGLIASGVLSNPFDFGFDILTTTTHKTLRGPRGGLILVRENKELAEKIDKAVFPGVQGGPHMHTIAAKAVCFAEAQTDSFKEYGRQVVANAKAMEAVFRREGVVMVFGGTDNHMLVIDTITSFGVSGKEAQNILENIGMTTNMNAIPDEPRSMRDPSGLRLGTPAVTTRLMKEGESTRIAELLIEALRVRDNSSALETIRSEVREIAEQFPIPEVFV